MKILAKKISKYGLLKFEFIVGWILMAIALVGVPIGIFALEKSLIKEPMAWLIVVLTVLFFCLVAYFCLVNPYIVYRKTPDILVESDGVFLYIHGRKEAKIPLAEITETNAEVNLPYLMQKEFLREFILHALSEEYGDLVLEIEGFGSYKLPFVARVKTTAHEFTDYINQVINAI